MGRRPWPLPSSARLWSPASRPLLCPTSLSSPWGGPGTAPRSGPECARHPETGDAARSSTRLSLSPRRGDVEGFDGHPPPTTVCVPASNTGRRPSRQGVPSRGASGTERTAPVRAGVTRGEEVGVDLFWEEAGWLSRVLGQETQPGGGAGAGRTWEVGVASRGGLGLAVRAALCRAKASGSVCFCKYLNTGRIIFGGVSGDRWLTSRRGAPRGRHSGSHSAAGGRSRPPPFRTAWSERGFWAATPRATPA